MESTIATIKKTKKLGIVIHDRAQLFSNGIVQNAYFLHQCCEAIGYTCQFLCLDPSPQPFEYRAMSVKQITTDRMIFNPTDYHTIVTVTRKVSNEIFKVLKSYKVAVVTLVCGNNYMYDQEEFLRGPKEGLTTYLGESRNMDEQWLIPSYHHALEYVEIIRKKPAFIVPHLWSSDVLKFYMPNMLKKPESSLFYDITKQTSKKINIVILEPNINFFKTAWLPIIAAEKLNKEHPDLVEFVFAFNFPEHDHAYKMTDTLALGPKLRKFQRKSIAEIIYFFNNDSSCMPIFVSHQVLNSLNYVYYELLHYGFPLVHNSPDLEGCGYYYPDTNLTKCVEQILVAVKHHNKQIETSKDKACEYLKRVDPMNPGVQKIFDQFVTASIVREHNSPARRPLYDIRNEDGLPIDTEKVETNEQILAYQYIKSEDVVLELGARYGSVSCMINSALRCKTNHVVIEPDERVWASLERNKLANDCEFHIVKGFLSAKKLALTKLTSYDGYGTTSIEDSDSKIPSYTLQEIKERTKLNFNVLVADCEGFLETFLEENPGILDPLRFILFEADCPEKCNYEHIRSMLREKGFTEKVSGHQNVWIRDAV